jgi:hypothetical protein
MHYFPLFSASILQSCHSFSREVRVSLLWIKQTSALRVSPSMLSYRGCRHSRLDIDGGRVRCSSANPGHHFQLQRGAAAAAAQLPRELPAAAPQPRGEERPRSRSFLPRHQWRRGGAEQQGANPAGQSATSKRLTHTLGLPHALCNCLSIHPRN